MLPHPLRLALTASFLFLGGLPLTADKIDLDRDTPVPAADPIPIQDFFRPRVLQEPKLNPSGTHVAALVTSGEDKYHLLVWDLATRKMEGLQGFGDKDIYHFDWLNDSRLMFGVSSEKLYGMGWMVADVGSLTSAYPVFQYCGTQPVSIPRRDRIHPLVWLRNEIMDNGHTKDGGVVSIKTNVPSKLGLINLRAAGSDWSLLMDVVENNDRHVGDRFSPPKEGMGVGYMADKDGELAFAFTDQNGVTSMHRKLAEGWEKCPVDMDKIEVHGSGEKPGEVVVLGPENTGTPRALQFMDASTGQLGDIIVQDKAYDFNGWLYRDPASRRIVGAIYNREGPATLWFNEEYRALQRTLDGFFPGLIVRIQGSDEKCETFLVCTYSDRQPPIYYAVDLKKKQVGLIKNSTPWIDPKRMRPMSIVKFKTRDGHQLDAYVTLPEGASKTNPAPLVVLPHGGPFVRDNWGYNAEVQFLASRGYAVMQPNYRGSTGYGWMFSQTEEWDFRKMSDDVTDATRTVLKTGLIDPSRVAIMGGSFGGYLAISGVVQEPTLYRCAITEVGVFDWGLMIRDSKYNRFENPRYAALIKRLGNPKKEKEKFEAMSPINFINQVQVPVFVAAGKDDPNVDVGQSKKLITQLDKYKIPHEVFLVSGEGHGMGHLENRVKLFSKIEEFLRKNLAPQAPFPAAKP